MIEGRELADWVERIDGEEEALSESAKKQCEAIFKKLFPRAKGKALHDEKLKTEIQLTINLNLGEKPNCRVQGFVPPTVVECREY